MRRFLIGCMHAVRRTKEFVGLFYSRKTLRGAQSMDFLGATLVGQGFMIASYRTMDHEAFVRSFDHLFAYLHKQRAGQEITVLDVGANMGFYAFAFAQHQPVHVLAYEPSRSTFEALKQNIAHNNMRHIEAFPVALFSQEKTMTMGTPRGAIEQRGINRLLKYFDREESGCRSMYHADDAAAETIDCFRGDDRQEILSRPTIDFIKIDVEGAELEALRGLAETVKAHVPVLQMEWNPVGFAASGTNPQTVLDTLRSLGYTHVATGYADADWWKHGSALSGYRAPEGNHDLVFYRV